MDECRLTVVMADYAPSIRIFQIAEALRPTLEEEHKTKFSPYTPIDWSAKDTIYDIDIRTQSGILKIVAQQEQPGGVVKYVSHALLA